MPNNKYKNPKKIHELASLVLIVDKDTLFENFFDDNGSINYELVIKKILLPYFKMKSRVIKNDMFFKIGEIGLKVTGLSPTKKGVVTSKTFIHCQNYYSLSTPIKRALLITTNKLDNFDQNELRKEILSLRQTSLLINKNEIAKIKHCEFFVRNCEPETGIINNESVITIENKDIINVAKLKIAVLKVIIIIRN